MDKQNTITRILIADDHHVVRGGLVACLSAESDFAVIGEVADGAQVITRVAQVQPDLLLLDAHMPGHRVLQTVKQLVVDFPALRILILSAYRRREYVVGLLGAGAKGYVLKDDSQASLPAAIRTVMAGGRWVSPQAMDVLVKSAESPPPTADLTKRETETLRLMAQGLRNAEIATNMCLTEQTVKNYVGRVLTKIGVDTRVAAVLYALKNGIASAEFDPD